MRTDRDALPAEAVVVATPAFVAAELVRGVDVPAADALAKIPYANTGVVHLVYAEGTADALPEATGFVVPRGRAPMTAATFVSRKWPETAFGTRVVVRCFVGALGFEDVLDEPDDDIVEAVCRHLAAFVPLPERADAASVVRWPRSMPQYEVGHLERVGAIETALPAGIFVTGNAYRGVGIADAVRDAGDTAERVRAYLGGAVDLDRARQRIGTDQIGERGMSETVYALYTCFKATRGFRDLDVRRRAAQEVENLSRNGTRASTVRGVYSTVGFRADTDLMLWLVGPTPDAVQDALVAFRRTRAGRRARARLDVHGRRQAGRVHAPITRPRSSRARPRSATCARIRSCARPSGTCSRRTNARRCCGSTARSGREFPEVLANTTSAFGINDWEWILAFEADELDRLVDCIRRLREAQARRFTKVEVPFVTGIRKDVRAAFADLA